MALADLEADKSTSLLGNVSADPSVWKVLWTLSIDAGMLGIGTALSTLGPTLAVLAQQVSTDFVTAGTIFTFRATGYLLGATVCGPAMDRISNSALVFLAPLIFAAFGGLYMPKELVYSHMCCLFAFQGISMGMLDTGGNVLIMTLWRGSKYQNGHMHALHFFFGLGASLGPTLVSLVVAQSYSSVIAWRFVGILLCPSCVGFLVLSLTTQPKMTNEEAKGRGFSSTVLLTGAFLFVYVGAEVAYGGYLYTFATRHLAALPVQASRLTALYWAMLCLSRLVAAAVTSHVNHTMYLVFHLVLALLSVVVLLLTNLGQTVGWVGAAIGTAAYGFALGPLFPGALLLCEEKLGHDMSATEASITVAAAAVGEMALPSVVGLLMTYDALNFGWVHLGLCSSAGLFFICVVKSGSAVPK